MSCCGVICGKESGHAWGELFYAVPGGLYTCPSPCARARACYNRPPKKEGCMRRLGLAVLALLAATAAARAQNDGGISDAQIRAVVERVAHHQLQPVTDGDYPAATSLEQAEAARPPQGIAWFYPQGVMLYGMARSTDLTHDAAVDQFVVRHNQVTARYYHWLADVQQKFGADAKDFLHGTKLRQLMELGTLDSCGAMGNALLDIMMRHPDQVTTEEREVLARIADWIVNRQARLPDGTLWRPERD